MPHHSGGDEQTRNGSETVARELASEAEVPDTLEPVH